MLKKFFAAIALPVLLGAAGAASAVADIPNGPAVNQINLSPPVTEVARQIYDLHNLMLVICLVIFFAVFSVMFWSIYAHRKSKGAKSANFHESTTVEIVWTIVPFLIVIGMALPATKTVVAMKDTSNADITVKVTGFQWKWGYDYIKGEGEGIAFLSALSTPRDQIINVAAKGDNYLIEVDNELVVPVGKKIRIITTASDVIHAWMVPAFGVKQDAIPGFVRDTWFMAEKVGTYRGQCAELCGKEHAFMPIVVKVVSEDDYSAWVAATRSKQLASQDDPSKTYTMAELKERGEKVFAANCVACHQANGKGIPGAFPALDGSKLVNAEHSQEIAMLLKGNKGMPAWKHLNDVELAAVTTFTKNVWGNQTGEVVQPVQVAALRK